MDRGSSQTFDCGEPMGQKEYEEWVRDGLNEIRDSCWPGDRAEEYDDD